MILLKGFLITTFLFLEVFCYSTNEFNNTVPPAPNPEPIDVIELPLPPALGNLSTGACTLAVNPHGSGCISQSGTESGDFTSDGLHVLATVTYVGAPASPDPASIYTGTQVILLKTDGTEFSNGDAWKCITCGVPAANQVGVTGDLSSYPQIFFDGTRAMSGVNIIDCGSAQLSSDACTPNKTYIYPLFLDDGTEAGFSLREMRLHPDNIHVTFNSFTTSDSGMLGEINGMARLEFNETGSRYDLLNATIFSNPYLPQTISVSEDGTELMINRSAISVGELRGWTGTGKEVTYIGAPWESCNLDLFAVDLSTGVVRRITAHPEYADPISVSPDDQWQVVLDTRGSQRMMFMSALRSVPPIIDLVATSVVATVRNNGNRRFFQPYLIDHDGDRGLYFGQQINAVGNGSAGAINDPNWNAGADPRWSLDGTKVSYYQWLAVSPACGGMNPLVCETSPYPDGRAARVMMATFSGRSPLNITNPSDLKISDEVPWGLKYTPGMSIPSLPTIPAGDYTLYGTWGGYANVSLVSNSDLTGLESVAVIYNNYSNDGANFLEGSETVSVAATNLTYSETQWFSNITSTGIGGTGTKFTGKDGYSIGIDAIYNILSENGTLTTTIAGIDSWNQPCNAC